MEEYPRKPDIHKIPQSPLLGKAKAFKELLKADNERLQKYIENGGDRKAISIDELDPNEDSYIEMTIAKGIFEMQGQMPEEIPDIDIPESEFRHASNYEGQPQ